MLRQIFFDVYVEKGWISFSNVEPKLGIFFSEDRKNNLSQLGKTLQLLWKPSGVTSSP
jgi:hypothetical protein